MPELNPTISFSPPTSFAPADPVWDEAFLRVESYLRAHHVESRVLLNRLTTEIIAEARAASSASATREPVAIAMDVTHARIGAWFARAGDTREGSNDLDRAHRRLALVLANLPGRWSNYFLSTESVPPDLAAAMASFQFEPAPDLSFSNMPPAPLEFGFDDTAHPPGAKSGGWPLVRMAPSWLIVVALMGVAWAASH